MVKVSISPPGLLWRRMHKPRLIIQGTFWGLFGRALPGCWTHSERKHQILGERFRVCVCGTESRGSLEWIGITCEGGGGLRWGRGRLQWWVAMMWDTSMWRCGLLLQWWFLIIIFGKRRWSSWLVSFICWLVLYCRIRIRHHVLALVVLPTVLFHGGTPTRGKDILQRYYTISIPTTPPSLLINFDLHLWARVLLRTWSSA